jgi:hypothetical protein
MVSAICSLFASRTAVTAPISISAIIAHRTLLTEHPRGSFAVWRGLLLADEGYLAAHCPNEASGPETVLLDPAPAAVPGLQSRS